jgi:hypothetical protein
MLNFREGPECELRLYGVLRSSCVPSSPKFARNGLLVRKDVRMVGDFFEARGYDAGVT